MMAARSLHRERTLGALLQGLAGDLDAATASLPVAGVALDSRRLQPGDVFLAYPGSHSDGRAYVHEAVGRGACAVVCEPGLDADLDVPVVALPGLRARAGVIASRWYGEPSARLRLIGVTGTNGKTTTTRLLAQLLRASGRRCGSLGTLGASTDERWHAGGLTTPDPVALQAQLAEWLQQGIEDVVMEVSSHALDQERVAGCRFHTAIFTNLSRDHLDYHATLSDYAAAKARLFAVPQLRFAVVNRDDAMAGQLLGACGPELEVVDFSVAGAPARWRCQSLTMDEAGAHLVLATPRGEMHLTSPLLGEFNAANLMAALAALHCLQPDFDARAAVAALGAVPGRMQCLPGRPRVIVDYAHTPDALAQVLSAVRQHCAGRLWCVFGCGGDRDRGKRAEMGRIAEAGADRVVLTSDNPRSEPAEAIVADIRAGMSRPLEVELEGELGVGLEVELDRRRAIEYAVAQAQAQDWILVAGKGHEQYQLIGDQRLPFDDVAVARAALAGRVPA